MLFLGGHRKEREVRLRKKERKDGHMKIMVFGGTFGERLPEGTEGGGRLSKNEPRRSGPVKKKSERKEA